MPTQEDAKGSAEVTSPPSCPDVYCADTSRTFRPESQVPPPKVNQVFRDPEFGSRIMRVTDEMGVNGMFPGFSFGTNSSAETNEWGKFNPALGEHGGYFFYVLSSGGAGMLFSMDASTMQVTPYCKGLPRCHLPGGGSFSYVDPNVIFGSFGSNGTINSLNIATGKQTTIYDFRKCPGVPDDFGRYPGGMSNSGDDTKFSGYAGGWMQGWGSQVTYYDRTTGHCYWYETGTGSLGGTGMSPITVAVGMLPPPHVANLSVTSGDLPAGDYYVQLTANTLRHPDLGETTPSPEAHIHLDRPGGISIAPPEIDNPYGLVVTGYNVYIGSAPGEERRQASVKDAREGYSRATHLSRGAAPPKRSTAGYDVHNARVSRNGKYVRIGPQNGASLIFWMPGTANISACWNQGKGHDDVASYCGGHKVMGFDHMINAGGLSKDYSLLLRPLSDLNQITQLLPSEVTVPASMDSHWSWNNVDSSDSAPVCGAFSRSSFKFQGDGTRNPQTNPVLAVRQPWDREIVCVTTTGTPKVWRFAHHHATGACNASAKDGSCFGAIAIGNVSQDGKFFLFSSDWDWSLGSDPHAPGCPTSGRCRVDSFIVELK